MGRPLSVSKSLAEFAARRRQRSLFIFSRDLCVRENTAQAASVEFCRIAAKLCAQQTWGPLSENPEGFSTISEKLSKRQLLHAVERGFKVFNADGAGDTEVSCAAYAEGCAGTDQDMRPL